MYHNILHYTMLLLALYHTILHYTMPRLLKLVATANARSKSPRGCEPRVAHRFVYMYMYCVYTHTYVSLSLSLSIYIYIYYVYT